MLTEDELIEQARKDFGELESYEKIGQPGKFLAALEAYNLNGCSDDESGDVESPVGHFYRVNRWVVMTNNYGFHRIEAHDTETEARVAFMRLDEEYCQWAGDDE